MGFSLEAFFDQLEILLASDKKAAKKIRDIEREVAMAKQYAQECGHIPDRPIGGRE